MLLNPAPDSLPLAVIDVPDLTYIMREELIDKKAKQREDTSSSWVTPLLWGNTQVEGQTSENNTQESRYCVGKL